MITIDYKDRTPMYEQIVENVKKLILLGVLPPGSRMPSVRQLSAELAINANTIQKAYQILEQQHILCSLPGRGNFIAEETGFLKTERTEEILRGLTKTALEAKSLGISLKILLDRLSQAYGEEVINGDTD